METNPGAYSAVRAAVDTRVRELGGAGESHGLLMLATDLATTEALVRNEIDDAERRQLRELWDALRSQR